MNACPPGTFAGGWWRADFSSFCNGTRYYIDCMQNCCGPDLGNGFCAGCTECTLRAAAATRAGSTATTSATGSATRRSAITRSDRVPASSRACRRTPSPSTRAPPPPRSTTPPPSTRPRTGAHRPPPPPKTFAAGAAECGRRRLVVTGQAHRVRTSLPTAPWRSRSSTAPTGARRGIPFAICTSTSAVTTAPRHEHLRVRQEQQRRLLVEPAPERAVVLVASWTGLGGNFISDPAMAADASGATTHSAAVPTTRSGTARSRDVASGWYRDRWAASSTPTRGR